MGLQNYAVTILNENSCIQINNNKINNIQKYDIAQDYRILHKVV
jgi:hypothetical protein